MYGNLKQGLAARKGVTPKGCKINFVGTKKVYARNFFFFEKFPQIFEILAKNGNFGGHF